MAKKFNFTLKDIDDLELYQFNYYTEKLQEF